MEDIKIKKIKKLISEVEEESIRLYKSGSFYQPMELIAHVAVNLYEKGMIDEMMAKLIDDVNDKSILEFKRKRDE